MKTCFKCLKLKPLNEFYTHKAMADGHLGKCKECAKKDVSEHRAKNIEKIRSYDRMRGRLPHRKNKNAERQRVNKEKHNEANRKYNALNGNKRKASTVVNNLTRAKKLLKQPCTICGSIIRTHAHHPDYSKPLEVIWLCSKHHGETHRRYK